MPEFSPKLLIETIKNNNFYFKLDAQIVFVCGRDINAKDSKRKIFLDYVRKHILGIHFFLAEDFFKSSSDMDEHDVLTLEDSMTKYADCIVIILESESAFCELGAFAIKDSLADKMLIINDTNFKHSNSFINNGPLKKIEANKKDFSGVLYTDMDAILKCASQVNSSFENLKKTKKQRIKFSDYDDFKASHKGRLLFLCDIIGILSPISYKEIISFFIRIYGNRSFDFLKFDVKMLQALKLIKNVPRQGNRDSVYIKIKSGFDFVVLQIEKSIKIRSDTCIYYKKNDPSRLNILVTENEN